MQKQPGRPKGSSTRKYCWEIQHYDDWGKIYKKEYFRTTAEIIQHYPEFKSRHHIADIITWGGKFDKM